ncbi:prolyl oligopeptidase family serine peptidase [Streptomyces sp. NBC_01497]|uniref:prolyl oligopeptidase family serine peptidase n=1 Tax=Streptomyces sp. NBC_01497 TaxID=2903885 RepID=UPI002E335D43|nr:prolyl oligopeptidase family serine peptidase [Streptomyces sp. NBC_01497]
MTVAEDTADPREVRRHGDWPSPLSPELAAAEPGAPSWPAVAGAETWWLAPDPATAAVRLLRRAEPEGAPEEALGPDWPVGSRAIGYGGRPYLVVPGGRTHLLVFCRTSDQRLYAARVPAAGATGPGTGSDVGTAPAPLTPADPPGFRVTYADPVLGPDGDEVWCVREVTRVPTGGAPDDPAPRTVRAVVAVPLSGAAGDDPDAVRVVASSHHFLSGVRVSPDGRRLAWIGWNHPDMPWDTSDLMVSPLHEGRAVDPVRVLGGPGVSVPQAEWAGPDTLYAMADPDGWWNLHRVELAAGRPAAAACVLRTDTECSHPIWRVGATSFAVTEAGVVFAKGGDEQSLVVWDPADGSVTRIAEEWTEFGIGLCGDAHSVAVVAASPTESATPLRVTLPTAPAAAATGAPAAAAAGAPAVVRRCVAPAEEPYRRWLSLPRRRVAVSDGWDVPYVYYPPTNPDHSGPVDALPPLLIDVHGGPTNRTGATRSLALSLFTSRGFAVASVDHGGSTGYGRAYRDRLRHAWGVVDVRDSVAVARSLAAEGLADPRRTAIRGGSAGGWTALAALAHSDVFSCGAVYYPISDSLTWSHGATHDFESRYIESLVGRLPDDEEHHRRVSPLANAAGITVPFVMFQGLDDPICRPDQARRMVEAVDAAHGPGLCFRHLEFPGEGHGFRRGATTLACLRAELALYAQVMGPS